MHRNELGGLWLMPFKGATLQGGLHGKQVGFLNFRRLQDGRRRKYYLQYMFRDIYLML